MSHYMFYIYENARDADLLHFYFVFDDSGYPTFPVSYKNIYILQLSMRLEQINFVIIIFILFPRWFPNKTKSSLSTKFGM